MTPIKDWFNWMLPGDRRQAARQAPIPLVAYFWNGDHPVAHTIRDASRSGLYLLTDQRWYPDTVLNMRLQRTGAPETDPLRSIAVNARVVHSGTDGVGFEFIFPDNADPYQAHSLPDNTTSMKTVQKFITKLQKDSGQALLEYIVVLPILFLLVVNLVNFGGFFYAWTTVADAARAGADYTIMGGSSAVAPSPATGTQVKNMITSDLASLPNVASLVVNICSNDNSGTVQTLAGTCSSATVPVDPEPTNYILTSVDVTYTYRPFIPLFSFPGAGVNLTIPPTTIHQVAQMRSEGGGS